MSFGSIHRPPGEALHPTRAAVAATRMFLDSGNAPAC